MCVCVCLHVPMNIHLHKCSGLHVALYIPKYLPESTPYQHEFSFDRGGHYFHESCLAQWSGHQDPSDGFIDLRSLIL